MPKVSRAKSLSSSDSNLFGRRDPRSHESQCARQRGLYFAAVDDQVEHAVIEQKFTALESLRQRLPDRLFDHARTGKADQGLRFRDVQVAEHREAGGDAAS